MRIDWRSQNQLPLCSRRFAIFGSRKRIPITRLIRRAAAIVETFRFCALHISDCAIAGAPHWQRASRPAFFASGFESNCKLAGFQFALARSAWDEGWPADGCSRA
eukprot:IDg8798t1